jgi:hypothetical protein
VNRVVSSPGRSPVASFAVLLALVLLTCWPVFGIRPFDGTNLYILSWADGARAGDLLRGDPGVYPEWRPLSYATVWLQYRWAAIDWIWTYYALNLLLWTACGWVTCRIVSALSGSVVAGLAAAAIAITSTQMVGSLVLIMERQSFLACLFGLCAWLVLAGLDDRQLTPVERVAVSLLLAASALSKEYGLAFVAATIAYSWHHRSRDLAVAGMAAAGIYAALRATYAGGAIAPFCDENGFFFGARDVCFDRLDAVTASQTVYNVLATGVGSLLPGLFFEDGRISVSPRWLLVSCVLLGLALIGWVKGPRAGRMGLWVIGFNTLLNFGVFRSRNHLAALCAVAIAAGVGLPIAADALRGITASRPIRVAAVALVLSVLSMRALVIRQLVADRVVMSSRPDACGPDIPDLDRAFMQRVWQQYNLTLPECAGR